MNEEEAHMTENPATDGGTTPSPQVWPSMRCEDAPAMIRFLVDAFGFDVTVADTDGDTVHHAELAWPEGGGIMLGSARESEDDVFPIRPGTFGAYVVTSDPDALYARARAAGAEITVEPTVTDYGSRDFGVRDPEGNRWAFGTYPGAPRRS